MSYTTIITEGGLLPADLLDTIASGDVQGQRAEDFGLEKTRRLSDAIAATWGEVRAYWDATQRSLARLREGESTTRITRERWIAPMLDALGYTELTYMSTAARVENRTYAISHRAGVDESSPPVHIEGFGSDLDRRPPSGRPRLSPHALLQEYLNSTEHLWGIVTNGERLRLLRDSSQISRPRYVEFDLRSMLDGEKFSEFAVLYRLLHRSRLPHTDADGKDSLLERYHQQAVESGGRVREGLREGVEEALKVLGTGLLQHPKNVQLQASINNGTLKPLDYYRQLLKLVYRLLFLMVAEERGLIAVSEDEADQLSPLHYRAPKDERLRIYLDHYSVGRLRRLAEKPGTGRAPYDDLWLNLQTTFRLLEGSDEQGAKLLGLAPLNGDLFGEYAIKDLINTHLRNSALLQAVRALSLYRDQQSKVWRRVNYGALDVEELGSVYESLLDYRPMIAPVGGNGQLGFELVTGTERKTTGSYYTRPELVQELIKSALEPVIEDRLKGAATTEAKERALLGITVCDPACGSGAFLLAAARRIGRELAKVRSGEEQPTPPEFRRATRDVIAKCIYGVDLNPLAVDLCKLSLWIEGHSGGMPLSFLDHHIKWGNSLVGATRELVQSGIPDDAYKPVTGDDRAVAGAIKKRNRAEREAWQKARAVQTGLWDADDERDHAARAKAQRELEAIPDSDVQAVRRKAERYQQLRAEDAAEYTLFNLWTAAFFQPLTNTNAATIPTTKTLLDHQRRAKPFDDLTVLTAKIVEDEVRFFHYELEFPAVFERDGFDVVIGNPPWERIKLQEQEFFSSHDLQIASAANKAARQKLVDALPRTNPKLAQAFERAKNTAEAQSRFVRESKRFPLSAVGDVNTYALFAEHFRALINSRGHAGLIVPTGIATDDTTKDFFGDLINQQSLVKLVGFENEAFIFQSVHHSFKFCALTMTGKATKVDETDFVFFCRYFTEVEQRERHFTLSRNDIALINPNTFTCPAFRSSADAAITKKIYRSVPVLVNERTKQNPWAISFLRMFDMSNDSHLFRTQDQLAAEGYSLDGNIFTNGNQTYVPLHEGKMVDAYNHRESSILYLPNNSIRKTLPMEHTAAEWANPYFTNLPTYWIPETELTVTHRRLTEPAVLVYKRVTMASSERTFKACLIPRGGFGDKLPVIRGPKRVRALLLLSIFNSIVFDFTARQKTGYVNLAQFVLEQLPVLPPSAFSADDIAYVSERVLELVYTAWDMQSFAQDVWSELDEVGRGKVLVRNVECNHDAPADQFAPRDGCPLPPFRWNDERRAHILAELDARIARLYGLTRDELRYILDPADVYGPDFPGETFRVLKEKETKLYGEYRTRRLVLEAWDRENRV
ncbi:MAG: N-6 DNA methylase [Chloroflexota bacterium]|nr:N-6 DNA methylase [Chloroflexota bacterium]